MSVEFIGFITNNDASETRVRSGPVLDPGYIETVAKAHQVHGTDIVTVTKADRFEGFDAL